MRFSLPLPKSIFIVSLFILAPSIHAQVLINWQHCYGGTNYEDCFSIVATPDGGSAFTGKTLSNDGDVSGIHSAAEDVWVVKIDNAGNIQWKKCLGGTGSEEAHCIYPTSDNGFILAGTSNSANGDCTFNHGGPDAWLVKLDSTGTIQWQKSYGGSLWDFAYGVSQTADGGYVMAGYSQSTDGDLPGNHDSIFTSYDAWVLKTDSAGTVEWSKNYGGTASNGEAVWSIRQTPNGEYIAAGYTFSGDGDVTGHHGGQDGWVLRLSATGNLLWQRCYGGSAQDQIQTLRCTSDNGFIFTGQAASFDGDVVGHKPGPLFDAWVVKLDSMGNIQWQNPLGGSSRDDGYAVEQTADGGYVMAGATISNNYDVSGWHGNSDAWVTKLNSSGTLIWQKAMGGSSFDNAKGMAILNSGNFICVGVTASNDYDVSGHHNTGSTDAWVVSYSASITTDIADAIENNILVSPNPSQGQFNFSGTATGSTITIYDLLGKIVLTKTITETTATIDISSETSGFYFYKIVKDNTYKVGKLCLEK